MDWILERKELAYSLFLCKVKGIFKADGELSKESTQVVDPSLRESGLEFVEELELMC